MVRFIPFNQNTPDEDRTNADIIQQVHTLSAIKEMLIAFGINYLPPENIDFDDEDKVGQDNFEAATLGLSHAIGDQIEAAEDPADNLRIILGHMFINHGYDPEEFEVQLANAIDGIAEFCSPAEEED